MGIPPPPDDATVVTLRSLTKRFGDVVAVSDLTFPSGEAPSPASSARTALGRRHASAAAGARRTDRGRGSGLRPPLPRPRRCAASGRRRPRVDGLPSRTLGTRPPASACPHRGDLRWPRRGGARARRAGCGGAPAREDILPRDAPKAGAGIRAPRRSRAPRP